MTITEASAVNKLVDWVLGQDPSPYGNKTPATDREAKKALKDLAKNSHKRLMAGATPESIDRRWKHRRLGVDQLDELQDQVASLESENYALKDEAEKWKRKYVSTVEDLEMRIQQLEDGARNPPMSSERL